MPSTPDDGELADLEPAERLARPGELCACGQPAVIVFYTARFGEIPYCGTGEGDVLGPPAAAGDATVEVS